MDESSSFGYWLRRRRKSLDLTQDDLAQRVGCATATIKKIEADERRPSRQLAERLAECLEVPQPERAAFLRAARAELAVSQLITPLDLPSSSLPARQYRAANAYPLAIRSYELHEQIGAGSFGMVYRAVQIGIGREVAVKMIKPSYADHPDFVRRFEAEAQIIARLEHPHIIPLYDYWREPGGAYLVTRYMRGGNLRERPGRGPYSIAHVTQLLAQLGAALDFAHRHGVIHRDLKPSNILLDEEEHAYLGDFGIARDIALAHTDDQAADGATRSSAYLSPEQLHGEPTSVQTDIYGLGILLRELLCGVHVCTDSTSDTQRACPDLPDALAAIIQRATATRPSDRYPDVLSLLAEWQRAVAPWTLANDHARGGTTVASESSAARGPHGDVAVRGQHVDLLENPYKGLRAFGEADAPDFFGREELTQRLIERLAEEELEARFLAVIGPSGSGKSSLVRAGLVPALRRGALPGSEHWFVVMLFPGAHPFEELEAALLRVAVNPPEHLLSQLREDDRGLARAVKRVLPDDSESEMVLVIDQFEELFTLTEDEAERVELLRALQAAVLDPRSRMRVIITLRADFTHRPLQYVAFGELLRERTEFVLPLAPEELRRAVVGPAQRVGLMLEPELATTIVGDVAAQPGAMPLLQYALTELFERRQGRMLTLAAYHASGGALGALSRRADELYARLNADEQEAARQIFLRLITLGEGVADTRRRVLLAELETAVVGSNGEHAAASAIQSVVNLYGRFRLLTFDRDPVTRGPTVEVAHEALIRGWDRLRQWIDAGRDELRVQRALTQAAAEWTAFGRDQSYLAHGARLAQFAALMEQGSLALNQDERAFVDASLAEQAAQRAHEESLLQRAESARERAEREARLSRSRELAAAAVSNLPVDPERSALLALEAVNTTYAREGMVLPEAESALHQAVPELRVLHRLSGHAKSVNAIAYSPDGARLVTASDDGTAKVWDAASGKELFTLSGHTAEVFAAVFSPDGTQIATGSADGTVKLWDATTGKLLQTLQTHQDQVGAVAFSPDGTRLVTGGADNSAKVWDLASGTSVMTLTGHTAGVFAVTYSPDGTRIATASDDESVKLWDATSGKEVLTLPKTGVAQVRFTPDGKRVVTSTYQNEVQVWDAGSGHVIMRAAGHSNLMRAIAVSPDGAKIATGSLDRNIKLWDTATGAELLTLVRHQGEVVSLAFSRDGTRLASASADGTARIWDITLSHEVLTIPQPEGADAFGYSRDGKRVARAFPDGSVVVWNARSGQQLRTIFAHVIESRGIALSPDGNRLAVVNDHNVASVWDITAGQELQILSGHADELLRVAFSRDGRELATTSFDGTAKLWDVATGKNVLTLTGHKGKVWGVAFSPDGKRIATTSTDRTARVWDATTGKALLTLTGHRDNVYSVRFSPDGSRIVTASRDGTAKVWDAATGHELLTLSGHTSTVIAAVFSPDGTQIATASKDDMVKLWDARSGQELLTLPGDYLGVHGVAFTPDGTQLLIAGGVGIRVFELRIDALMNLARQRLTRTWTEDECQRFLHLAQCPAKA